MALKISQSGIRGTLSSDDTCFSPIVILKLLLAYGSYLNKQKDGITKIAIGRDGRRSSLSLSFLAKAALSSIGCEIIDADLIMTPVLQFNVRNSKDIDGGIMITASHNPAKWAGFKFLNKAGELFSSKELDEIKSIYENRNFFYLGFDNFSILDTNSYRQEFIDSHTHHVLNNIPVDKIKNAVFKVAVDCCSSSGIQMIDFLEKLDCKVIPINDMISYKFNRNPEPTAESLSELSKITKESGADIGFALDPDGDRLVLVDNFGKVIPEDYTFLLVLYYLLKFGPDTKNIVISCTVSSVIKRMLEKESKDFILIHETPVGEKYLTDKMKEIGMDNVLLAGEDSGSAIIPWINFARDSITNAGIILSLLAEKNMRISDLVYSLPQLNRKKFKIQIDISKSVLIQEMFAAFKNVTESINGVTLKKLNRAILIEKIEKNESVTMFINLSKLTLSFSVNKNKFDILLKEIFSSDDVNLFQEKILDRNIDLSFQDGVKISSDKGYLLFRLSNTENLIRVIFDYLE
jgi:phosphomannomutase